MLRLNKERRKGMSYTKSEHQNAITKLVREKRMILQADAACIMNKDNINSTVKLLVKEGKIKRQKVKVRGSVGNLIDMWLLHSIDVKQAEILEYEKILINRPYNSPLIKNHCYKKVESPIEQEIKSISQNYENNIVNMQDYIKVNNRDLKIKEYKGERIVTIYDVAQLHEISNRTIKENFNNNKQYLKQNEDYFILSKVDYEKFVNEKLGKEYNAIKEVILFTEQGYLLIVKSLTGEKAWEVQRQLIKAYFKVKEIKEKQENNLPITQQDFQPIQILEQMFLTMKDQDKRITQIENKLKLLAE
jgi:phage regulator Rha-like protein